MRVETPSQSKGKGTNLPHAYPCDGSNADRLLSRLKATPGRPVGINDLVAEWGYRRLGAAKRDLVDYYGMDIRTGKRGHGARYGGGVKDLSYILVGEWFGLDYRDYVNEAIDAAVIERDSAKSKDSQ